MRIKEWNALVEDTKGFLADYEDYQRVGAYDCDETMYKTWLLDREDDQELVGLLSFIVDKVTP